MLSLPHLLVLLLIVIVLFGAGRIPRIMGDIGTGMRNLREGLKGEGETPPAPTARPLPPAIDHVAAPVEVPVEVQEKDRQV